MLAGKAVLFTGSFGGDCVPMIGGVNPNPCHGVAVIAPVQIAGHVFDNSYIGGLDRVINNPIVVGPATVTFTNLNPVATYRFVTGVASVLLQR